MAAEGTRKLVEMIRATRSRAAASAPSNPWARSAPARSRSPPGSRVVAIVSFWWPGICVMTATSAVRHWMFASS